VFVTFEGPEGAGKSTVIAEVVRRLHDKGVELVVTREPGAGEFGAEVRNLLLHGGSLDPTTELFLFLADRAEHVAKVIRPALDDGMVVICDRFADSTIVYQGHARGLDLEMLRNLNEFATAGLKPDLTLLLDLAPEVGLARITNKDRLDSEPVSFHHRVRDGFIVEALREPSRWKLVDASAQVTVVADSCWAEIVSRLG